MAKRERGDSAAVSLTKFDFYGDELDVIRRSGDEREVWVSVRRICEVLGLSSNMQVEKLKKKAWASGMFIISDDARGRNRELFCVPLRALPMWLGTVEPTRSTSPDLKRKLDRFQKECAEVLADHFLGKRGALPAGAVSAEGVQRLHMDYATKLSAMQAEARDLRHQRDQALAASSALIAEQDLLKIRTELDTVSRLMVLLGRCRKPTMASARMTVRNRVLFRWLGAGKKLDGMPRELVAEVLAALHVMRREYESELKRKGPASQQTIFDALSRRHSVN